MRQVGAPTACGWFFSESRWWLVRASRAFHWKDDCVAFADMIPVTFNSCDWNRYSIQYALAVSKQRGMKRPSEPLGSEEEAGASDDDDDDDDDSLHLLGGGHGGEDEDGLLA